jgi:probable rRNA maturation factor
MSGTPKRKPGRTPELALTVQYGTRSAQLPSRAKFGLWVRAALRRKARVTLRLVGAREARLLNLNYRGCDYATNVLTFIYSGQRPLEGDIAICAPVVAREAFRCGIRREAHYAHLTVHGVLHLQGYDHARAADAIRMEKLETRILARLGFADPYRDTTQDGIRKSARPRARASRLTPHASREYGR